MKVLSISGAMRIAVIYVVRVPALCVLVFVAGTLHCRLEAVMWACSWCV